MTSYASAQRTPIRSDTAAATLYWKITAPVLGAVAALGFVLNLLGAGAFLPHFLEFDLAHNVVHLLLAGIAAYLGFGAPGSLAKTMAKVVGVVYLALAAVGFLSANVFGIGSLLGLHLELGENLIHLVLGGWAAYAGFSD